MSTGERERPLALLFTDSLGMPREFLEPPDRTTYADTYVARLRAALADTVDVDVIQQIGLDSENALYWAKFLVLPRRPDVVVLHLGVVDCAPRVFRKGSPSLLLRPWFGKLTRGYALQLIHLLRPLLIRARKVVYVKQADFERNLIELRGQIRAASPGCRIIALGISQKPLELEHRSPGYRGNVERYNAVLERVFGDGYVDPSALVPLERQLISDGIHLTPEAHAAVAEELVRRISADEADA